MRGLRGLETCAGSRTGENLREHPQKQTSVVTDGNRRKRNDKCAVCAVIELARVWKGCRRQGGTERSGVETER